jgi:hypothetical protein
MLVMSAKSGTFRSTHSSDVRSVAASAGRAAFFEPLIFTSPRSGWPPVIRMTRRDADNWTARSPAVDGVTDTRITP